VVIDLRVSLLGNTLIKILESPSDNIEFVVHYTGEPRIKYAGDENNQYVNFYLAYPSDVWNIGGEVYVYLPKNATYYMNIQNDAADTNDIWRDNSNTTFGEFKGPIKIYVSNQTVIDKNGT
jgi:hypothetical protein